MSLRSFILRLLLAAPGPLAGCAGNLPLYPVMSDDQALAKIAERNATINSFSLQCELDLTDPLGQQVRLEGVLVAEPPHRARLRTWKFGHAIFDLTIVDDKVWLIIAESGPGSRRLDMEALPLQQVSEALYLLGPGYFRSARPAGGNDATLLARGSAFGSDDVFCHIQRPTLTPRRFVVSSTESADASELLLEEYVAAGNLVWPKRLRFRSQSGEVVMHIRELEFNTQIPLGAFTPPRRAKAVR